MPIFQQHPPAGPPPSPRAVRSATLLAWILFGALAILLRVDWHLAYGNLPLYHSPAVDEALHWQWAQDLAAGKGSPEVPYFRAPLYLWWLGLLKSAGLGLAGLRWAGTLLGTGALALLVALAGRTSGKGAALAALLLAGSCATWIHYEPQLLLEHLVLLWLLGAGLFLHLGLRRAPGWADLGLGLTLGLAAITRPNALVLAPLALGLLWRTGENWKGWMSRALWWAGGWLPPLALVAALNGWPASGVLIASQGGVNLWIGTHGGADGWSATLPEIGSAWERADATGIVARALGHPPSPAEESAFYSQRAMRWAMAHPTEVAGQIAWKSALLLAPHETGNNTSPLSLARQRGWMSWLLPWSWWLVLLPGITGLVLGFPRQSALRRWVWASSLLYGASFLPFFIAGRFRIPLIGLLALPAAAWLADLWQGRRLRTAAGSPPTRQRRMVLAVLVILPFLSALWVQQRFDAFHRRQQEGWQVFQLGNAWQRLGELDSARACFEHALSVAPGLKELRVNLGLLSMERDPALARKWFEEELRVDPRSAKAWNNLGSLWMRHGQPERAVAAYQQALNLRPDLPDVHWNLGLAWAAQGLECLKRGDLRAAREALNEVKATPYDGRGLHLLRQGLGGEALSGP